MTRGTLTSREEEAKKQANKGEASTIEELANKKKMIHLLSPSETDLTVSGRQLEDVPTLIRNAERLLGRTTEGQEELITSLYVMDFKVLSKDNEVKEESGV